MEVHGVMVSIPVSKSGDEGSSPSGPATPQSGWRVQSGILLLTELR